MVAGGVALASSQAALEPALPVVKTDEEAIAEYEAYKAGEQTLQERLGKSARGKGRRLQLYNVQRLNAEEGNCSGRSTNNPVGQPKSTCCPTNWPVGYGVSLRLSRIRDQ